MVGALHLRGLPSEGRVRRGLGPGQLVAELHLFGVER